MLPAMVIVPVPAKDPVKLEQLRDLAPVLPDEIVTVPVDDASKNTSSAVVGTLAPPGPPEVVAHFVPAVPSQFAVPPTQYRSAMSRVPPQSKSLLCLRGNGNDIPSRQAGVVDAPNIGGFVNSRDRGECNTNSRVGGIPS